MRVLRAHALHVVAIGGLALLAGLLLAAILLAFLVLVLGIAAAVLAHFERVEQIVHGVAELALVLDHALELVEIAPGAVLDERTPQIDQLLRGRRRRQAGQPLAHHQRHRLLDRRIGAVGDLVEFAAMEAVIEHRGEILGDAVHAARADRLDARLLDRLEHRARLLAGRLQAAMHRRVVAGNSQRDRIGMAAHDRGFALLSLRGGSGSRTLPPIRPGRSAAKETSSSGLRAIARRQPVTARLNGSVGDSLADGLVLMLEAMALLALPIGGEKQTYDSATLTELSGNSTPKQR